MAQESAIRRTYEKLIHEQKPVYLFSGYLAENGKLPRIKDGKKLRPRDTALAFSIDLGVQVPVYEVDKRFWMDEHFEGGYVFSDTITFHVRRDARGTTVKYGLSSKLGSGVATRSLSPQQTEGVVSIFEIPIGFKKGARVVPKPGLRGRLQLIARPWNA